MYKEENLNTDLFCHFFTHAEGAAKQLYAWLRENPGKAPHVESFNGVLMMSTAKGKPVFVSDCTEVGELDAQDITRQISHFAAAGFSEFFESENSRHSLDPQFHILYQDPDDTEKHEPILMIMRYGDRNLISSIHLQNISAMSQRKLAGCPFLKEYLSFRRILHDQYSRFSNGAAAIMYAMARMGEKSCMMPYFADCFLEIVDICLAETDQSLFHKHWFEKGLHQGTMFGLLKAMELKGKPLEEAVDELLKQAEYAGNDRAALITDYRLIQRNIAEGLFDQDIR